jgi:hypothetical protein
LTDAEGELDGIWQTLPPGSRKVYGAAEDLLC